MGPVDQLFCTHCTFGTSAIERREGEGADRVMGYTARASSLPPHELRRNYRAFERYVYYRLPSDSEPESKLTMTPEASIPRFVYVPASSGFQILGHIRYRQWDVARKRPGSYFAHLLVGRRERDDPAWDVLQCLQFWNHPLWTIEDDPSAGHDLSQFGSLREAFASHSATLDDRLLVAFLMQPGDSLVPADPRLIPDRWRAMKPAERREFFTNAFRGYLETTNRRGTALSLVIEPEIAPLIFYGIARLLPPSLRQNISFSTYEDNADRLSTSLAAVVFENPAENDIRAERYQRDFVIHTFQPGKMSRFSGEGSVYAEHILKLLLDGPQGPLNVDQALLAFESANPRHIKDLEELISAEHVIEQLADPQGKAPPDLGQLSQHVRDYVCTAVKSKVLTPADPALLDRILANPPHFKTALEIIGSGNDPAVAQALQHFLTRLPPQDYAILLASPLAKTYKAEALAAHVEKRGSLPPGCDSVWTSFQSGGRRGKPEEQPLLVHVVAKLSSPALDAIIPQLAAERHAPLFLALHATADDDPDRHAAMARLVGGMPVDDLGGICQQIGKDLLSLPQEVQLAFRRRLVELLNSLHKDPEKFASRMSILQSTRPLLNDQAQQRMAAWDTLRQVIDRRLAAQQAKPEGALDKIMGLVGLKNAAAQAEQARQRFCRALAEAVMKAIPAAEHSDVTPNDKGKIAQQIARAAGIPASEFDDNFVHDAAEFIEWKGTKIWGGDFRRRSQSLKNDRYKPALMIFGGSVAAVLLLVIAIGGYRQLVAKGYLGGTPDVVQAEEPKKPAGDPPSEKPPTPPAAKPAVSPPVTPAVNPRTNPPSNTRPNPQDANNAAATPAVTPAPAAPADNPPAANPQAPQADNSSSNPPDPGNAAPSESATPETPLSENPLLNPSAVLQDPPAEQAPPATQPAIIVEAKAPKLPYNIKATRAIELIDYEGQPELHMHGLDALTQVPIINSQKVVRGFQVRANAGSLKLKFEIESQKPALEEKTRATYELAEIRAHSAKVKYIVLPEPKADNSLFSIDPKTVALLKEKLGECLIELRYEGAPSVFVALQKPEQSPEYSFNGNPNSEQGVNASFSASALDLTPADKVYVGKGNVYYISGRTPNSMSFGQNWLNGPADGSCTADFTPDSMGPPLGLAVTLQIDDQLQALCYRFAGADGLRVRQAELEASMERERAPLQKSLDFLTPARERLDKKNIERAKSDLENIMRNWNAPTVVRQLESCSTLVTHISQAANALSVEFGIPGDFIFSVGELATRNPKEKDQQKEFDRVVGINNGKLIGLKKSLEAKEDKIQVLVNQSLAKEKKLNEEIAAIRLKYNPQIDACKKLLSFANPDLEYKARVSIYRQMFIESGGKRYDVRIPVVVMDDPDRPTLAEGSN